VSSKEIHEKIDQELIKFERNEFTIYNCKVLDTGILSENQLRQSKLKQNKQYNKSGHSSNNISVELNISQNSHPSQSVISNSNRKV